MSKIRATVLVDRELWKKFRAMALDKDTTASKLINDFIQKHIEKTK